MAIRIRKLAKELRRSPDEVLGILHALGFDRFRSPEDMVSKGVVDRLRTGLREGVRPKPLPARKGVVTPEPTRTVAPPPTAASDDFMRDVMAGMVDSRAAESSPARAQSFDESLMERPLEEVFSPSAQDSSNSARELVAEQTRVVQADREKLQVLEAEVREQRRAIREKERLLDIRDEALQELQAQLDRERLELTGWKAEKEEWELRRAERQSATVRVHELLGQRGLRGSDEQERALSSLFGLGLGPQFLDLLVTTDATKIEKLLEERLVLTTDGLPEPLQLQWASVFVTPERVEVPALSKVRRSLEKLADCLLINGYRKVTLFGGKRIWQQVLKHGLDSRIQLNIHAGGRNKPGVATDNADLVIVWNGTSADRNSSDQTSSSSNVIYVQGQGLEALVDGLARQL